MELRRWARLVGFGGLSAFFLLGGAALTVFLLPVQPARQRRVWAALTRRWARSLLWLLGVRVRLLRLETPPTDEPLLLVANHQSYLDILICAAYFPACFIAKAELQRWPVLGWLARLSGTLFLDRASTASAVRCVFRASRALRNGGSVQVFPEGTTTNGVAPPVFKPLFFAAALRAQVRIQPLSIVLHAPDELARARFCWVGEEAFVGHFWRLLAQPACEITLIAHPLLQPLNRAATLAQTAQALVQSGLAWPMLETARATPASAFAAVTEEQTLPQF